MRPGHEPGHYRERVGSVSAGQYAEIMAEGFPQLVVRGSRPAAHTVTGVNEACEGCSET